MILLRLLSYILTNISGNKTNSKIAENEKIVFLGLPLI